MENEQAERTSFSKENKKNKKKHIFQMAFLPTVKMF